MTKQDVRLRCNRCRHVWDGYLLVDVPVNDAAIYMRGLACPECHADSHEIYLVDEAV